jgi:hypothetical protein
MRTENESSSVLVSLGKKRIEAGELQGFCFDLR